MIGLGSMYFLLIIDDHRESLVSRDHPILAVRDLKKYGNYLMPHPPHSLGLAIFSHATQDNEWSSLDPSHKNLWQILRIRSIIPFGIHDSNSQKTEMDINTDLTRTILPTLDNHL